MPIELLVLGLSVLLAAVQLALFAVPANLEIGTAYLAGPRDDGIPPMSARTGRLHRAYQNHIEGLVLFTGAVVVVIAGDRTSDVTAGAAMAYLAARVVYVPCYWTGVLYVRSLVWWVGFASTLVMVMAALTGV